MELVLADDDDGALGFIFFFASLYDSIRKPSIFSLIFHVV